MFEELDERGFVCWRSFATIGQLAELRHVFEGAQDRPGSRIIAAAASNLEVVVAMMAAIPTGYRVVRAIAFDKSANNNWALGWHQDRTIAVERRVETPGFRNWTVKSGVAHVAPPVALLERMLTARIHLDAVDGDNAPLLVAPGSHRLGLVAEDCVASVVDQCGTATCTALAGDVWMYRTLILHASDRASAPSNRRVLQLDFSADRLPGELEWASAA